MNSRHETVNIFKGLTSSKLKHRKWESLLDKAELLSRNTFHIIAINQPACIWQADPPRNAPQPHRAHLTQGSADQARANLFPFISMHF